MQTVTGILTVAHESLTHFELNTDFGGLCRHKFNDRKLLMQQVLITAKCFIQLQDIQGLKRFTVRQTPEIGSEMFTNFPQTLAT